MFNKASDLASEKSFLNRSARSKAPDYDDQPKAEQLKLKISLLEHAVNRDENDLVTLRENIGNVASPLESRQAEGKLRLQVRKVNAKRDLLDTFRGELASS